MNILTLTNGNSARQILIDRDQILALDVIESVLTKGMTRIYLKGGLFKDVMESVRTIRDLFQSPPAVREP